MSQSLIFVTILLASCSGLQATATPTSPPPAITATSSPRATLTATPTLTPTVTPTTPLHAGLVPYTTQVRVEYSSYSAQDEKVRYLLYLPESYFQDTQKNWPLILYLHGSGEAGTDLSILTRTGLPEKLKGEPDFPFIVVSPQIPAPPQASAGATSFDVQNYLETWGWNGHIREMDALLDELQTSLRIDPQHMYLTGISLGAFGAWRYALQYPQRFAAVVPLAGGNRFVDNDLPADLCDLKDLPIWAFHGALDGNVSPERSQVMVDGLKACGSTVVRFTLYPDHPHDVWSTAYNDPALWDWLLAQESK